MYFGGKINEGTQWNNKDFNSFMLSILLRRETMVNVLKFGTRFSFCSHIRAESHKMLVKITNREDPDQTAPPD